MTACEWRRLLRGCGRRAPAACQYCGLSFCEEHGARLDDGQEICARATCQRKQADLQRHFAYREAVVLRNGDQRCGAPDCNAAAEGQCAKCSGLFCRPHLEVREIEERRGGTVERRLVSLCRHCQRRRKLWSKR